MAVQKKTLVIGASTNPNRYSYLAIDKLRQKGHPVVAIGQKEGQVLDVDIQKGQPSLEQIDTVTLYLNAKNQAEYQNYILRLHPKRIIFNPGAENDAFADEAEKAGIKVLEACTLVMLSTNQY